MIKPTDKQASAIDAVARWYKKRDTPIFRLFGYAGSGKSTVASHFAQGIKNVQYMAYTGKAAMVMRTKGCDNASTIHSTIYTTRPDEETGEAKFRRKSKRELAGVDLFIIDECSFVDEKVGKDILSFGVPVLVLGDPGQLPPVGGAGYFVNEKPDFMLDEILRQARDNPIIQLATDVREGRKLKVGRYGAASVMTKKDINQDRVVAADQVIVGTHRSRMAYNKRLREIYGYLDVYPQPGDRLIACRNDHDLGVMNGSIWEMVETVKKSQKSLTVKLKSLDFEGEEVETKVLRACFEGGLEDIPYSARREYMELDYGYAITCHKAQGSQWPYVVLFDESNAFRDDWKRWLYTGITRAAESLTVVINS